MRDCPQCGAKVEDDVDACPTCGAAIDNEKPVGKAEKTGAEKVTKVPSEQEGPKNEVVPEDTANVTKVPLEGEPAEPVAKTEEPRVSAGTEKPSSEAEPKSEPKKEDEPKEEAKSNYHEKLEKLNDTEDTTDQFTAEDIEKNKVFAALSYIPLCFFIPMFAVKDSGFAKYHENQGLVLFIAEAIYYIVVKALKILLGAISWRLIFIARILSCLNFVFVILAIVGIINAANGRAKELPCIGKNKFLK